MAFTFEKTKLPGVIVIQPQRLLIDRKINYTDVNLCKEFRHIFNVTKTG